MAAKANDKVKIFITPQSLSSIDELRLGFIQSSNPRKFNAMLQLATLNAAKQLVKPIQAKAPVRTGRLKGAVAARKARQDRPASVVGVKSGKSRGDSKGAWYKWFVVSGTSGTRVTKRLGKISVKAIAGRDFVRQGGTDPAAQAKALDVLNKTIMAFLDGALKYKAGKGKK